LMEHLYICIQLYNKQQQQYDHCESLIIKQQRRATVMVYD
jgi:hypothetical protein